MLRSREWSPGVGSQYDRPLSSHPYPAGSAATPVAPFMPDKLRPSFGPVPGMNEMDPRWNDYMKSVTDWYERMGYPGFNPFMPRPRSRSPRRLTRKSRSRSADSGRKRKRSVSPENDRRRSRSREYDARGRPGSRRSRSRESGSRHGFVDKETRSLKPSSKRYTSKHDPKMELRVGKSKRVQALKSKDSRSAEASTKDRPAKKPLHAKPSDGTLRLPKSEEHALKQVESFQAPVESQQPVRMANVEERPATEVKKLLERPAVQPKKKVVSLMDLKLHERYRQPVVEAPHGKIAVSEPVTQKETVEVNQKPVTENPEQNGRLKGEMDNTALASKKADNITPVVTALEHEKEKVEKASDVSPSSPVPENVVEAPSTTEAELVTNEKPAEVLPPSGDESYETDSKPGSVEPEPTARQLVAARKTEVSTKNIAQVKPLLVASVPEKSKWERDTDVSDSRDSPIQATRRRDRLTALKTSLPRYVYTFTSVHQTSECICYVRKHRMSCRKAFVTCETEAEVTQCELITLHYIRKLFIVALHCTLISKFL